MGKQGYCMCFFLVLSLAVAATTARNVPSDAGLNDQKNFLTYGGVGGYSGIGANGMPFGGVGAGMGAGGGGLGAGVGGFGGLGGGGVGGGAGAGLGGGSAGGGFLPFPRGGRSIFNNVHAWHGTSVLFLLIICFFVLKKKILYAFVCHLAIS
uniref:Glycine-rich protein n=1 Tax=Onobrychis viciifolia TaxID=3882 RepID=O22600_ONOVI|nr:glycine-rich protein [Onobrychis viciifolia]